MVAISVILPVFNAAATLGAQLDALSRQTTDEPWELIVADNGSTDESRALAESKAHALPCLRVVDARDRRGVAHARNVGARAAAGEFLLFCDADDQVHPGWIAALHHGLSTADAVAGSLDRRRLNDPAVVGTPRDRTDSLNPWPGFLSYGPGSNFAVHRRVWDHLGGQDESYQRAGAEDTAFCWRLQLAGFTLTFAADAVVDYRERAGLRHLARQHFRYGTEDPRLFRDFRDHGMPASSLRRALRSWGWLLIHAPALGATRSGRREWTRMASRRAGRLVASLRGPTRYW